MSDFITRLAQRQLGQIVSVMPRLPEMFAPFAAPMPTPTLSAEEIPAAAPARRQNDFVPRPTLGAVAQPDSFASAAELTAMSNRRDATRSSGAVQPPENQVVEAPLAAFAVKIERSQTRTNSSYDGEWPLTAQAFSEQSGLADVAEEVPPLPARRVSDPPTQHIAIASSAPVAITAPPRLEPQKTSHRTAVAPAAGLADAESPVHVTIGRIEVTALTQAAPAKRAPAPRKPAMSLDDYLSRRQRGER